MSAILLINAKLDIFALIESYFCRSNINSMVSESPRRALSNDINIVGEFVELKKLLSKTTIFGGGHFFLSHTVCPRLPDRSEITILP